MTHLAHQTVLGKVYVRSDGLEHKCINAGLSQNMGMLCTDPHTSTNGQGSNRVSSAVVLPMEDSMINCKHCCAWLWRGLCAAAVSLFILPESPRWLVVNGHLDVALAVIHRVYTKSILPAGCTSAPFACCTCQWPLQLQHQHMYML